MGKRKDYSVFDARIPVLTTRLRALIDNSGGTAVFLEGAEYTRAAVNHWYNGSRTPDAKALRIIGKEKCVSVDYLLGLSDCPSLDEDIKRICEYTGLAYEAVEVLHYLKANNDENCISDTPAANRLNVNFINRVLGSYYAQIQSAGAEVRPIETVFSAMERYTMADNAERELSGVERTFTDEEKNPDGGCEIHERRIEDAKKTVDLSKKSVTIAGDIPHVLQVGELYREYLFTKIRKMLDYYADTEKGGD